MSDTRKEAWMGLEETLLSASQHLGQYIEYAKARDLPLILPTEAEVQEQGEDAVAGENGYAVLGHAMACVEAVYAAMEDGDIIELGELRRIVLEFNDRHRMPFVAD